MRSARTWRKQRTKRNRNDRLKSSNWQTHVKKVRQKHPRCAIVMSTIALEFYLSDTKIAYTLCTNIIHIQSDNDNRV